MGRERPDFSFSGLKTAVRQMALSHAPLSKQDVADLCASFQAAAADVLRDRLRAAFRLYEAEGLPRRLVAAGGVASNRVLRTALLKECDASEYEFRAPPPGFCTDNAAMIAWAAPAVSPPAFPTAWTRPPALAGLSRKLRRKPAARIATKRPLPRISGMANGHAAPPMVRRPLKSLVRILSLSKPHREEPRSGVSKDESGNTTFFSALLATGGLARARPSR